ncbi:hypothetical protein Tco_0202736 [Tanacetum coccineum]
MKYHPQTHIPLRSILGVLQIGIKSQGYRELVMSSDSAVTYTSVHSEARSWSILSEDPYEEAARQLLEHAPRPSEYVPDPIELEDHVPVYILEPEHPHVSRYIWNGCIMSCRSRVGFIFHYVM